jgi:hypothetical protein
MPHLRPPRRQLPVVTGYGVDNIKRGLVDLRVPGDIQTDVGGRSIRYVSGPRSRVG